MTRKEAIEKLELMRQKVDEETYRALILAIKALEQEPTEKPMCDRNICISNEYNGIGCDECIVNKVGHKPCRVKNELNVELNELKPCTDAVSREAVLDEIEKWIVIELQYTNATPRLIKRINELPSVTQKSGKWIDYRDDGFVECPFCGHATNCEDDIDELHYCFYCGAKMESEE